MKNILLPLSLCVFLPFFIGCADKTPIVISLPPHTATPTTTVTHTATITSTPTVTSTPTPWCPGSGVNGISAFLEQTGFNQSYTFVERIYFGATVNISDIIVSTNNMDILQRTGVYSDDGSGTLPVSLMASAVYSNNVWGGVLVDIPDITAGPGYVWLAISSDGDYPYSAFTCPSCEVTSGYFDGMMPPLVTGGFNVSNSPIGIQAVWACY